MAKRSNIELPSEVEQFFAATEAGNWPEVTNRFAALRELRIGGGTQSQVPPAFRVRDGEPAPIAHLWGPILETFGAAEVVHDWPAQQLLDYGQAILGSLRPGMVYVGGTDPGRFIPTLLNETSDGERHIVLTQNGLADNTYLDYVNFLYGDRLGTLSGDDSKSAFETYLQDAQKRLEHDKQFPNELKQIRPGEDVRASEGRVQVSGQVAVMAINEKLLTMIMDKNPGLSFALEESFPLKSTYAAATPLGPIMELRTPDAQSAFTADRANQTVDYWRETAQQFLNAPDAPDGSNSDARRTYSKMAAAQGALLADHKFGTEAELAYQYATEICPYCPEVVFGYVGLLMGNNRVSDAIPVVERAAAADPSNDQMQAVLQNLKGLKAGK